MTANADDRRVSLAPFDGCDPFGGIPWLPEAWSAIDGLRPGSDAPSSVAGLLEVIEERWPDARVDRIDIMPNGFGGFIAFEVGREEIVIRAVSVRRDGRNLGYGGEAVERLEASWPERRFVAAVPRYNGLAIYFWLRVGFRPVRLDEDRERTHDPDFLWMLRAEPTDASGARSDP